MSWTASFAEGHNLSIARFDVDTEKFRRQSGRNAATAGDGLVILQYYIRCYIRSN